MYWIWMGGRIRWVAAGRAKLCMGRSQPRTNLQRHSNTYLQQRGDERRGGAGGGGGQAGEGVGGGGSEGAGDIEEVALEGVDHHCVVWWLGWLS